MRAVGRWWWSSSMFAVALAACATGTGVTGSGGGGHGATGGSGGGTAGTAGSGGTGGAGGEAGSSGAGGGDVDGGAGTSGAGGGAAGTGGSSGTGGTAGAGGASGTGGAAGSGGGTGGSAGAGGSGTCTPPVSGPCDDFPQCGCNAGQNCDVTSVTGATACVAAGSTAANGNCSNVGECGAGFTCVGGACKSFCDADSDCNGTHRTCVQVSYDPGDGGTTPVPQLKVCTSQCDLVDPSTVCGSGVTCVLTTQTGPGTDCVGGAGTATGANGCSSASPLACAPGYVCLQTNECAKWCRVGFPGDCPSGQSCANLTTPPMIDGVQYGICQ